jgi:hypothetical protein
MGFQAGLRRNLPEEANAAQQAEIAMTINVQVAVDVSDAELFPFA